MEEEGRDGVRVEKKRQRGERKDTKAGDHKSPWSLFKHLYLVSFVKHDAVWILVIQQVNKGWRPTHQPPILHQNKS